MKRPDLLSLLACISAGTLAPIEQIVQYQGRALKLRFA